MEEKTLKESTQDSSQHIFSGNIYLFHAFDVGEDIDLEKIEKLSAIKTVSLTLPKYFKNYHKPLAIELPQTPGTSQLNTCVRCKIHKFGAISLTYKIPFEDTLENVRKQVEPLDYQYQGQSISDVKTVYEKIEKCIETSKFFQTKSSYVVIQVTPQAEVTIPHIKDLYGSVIASALRFETQSLSEYQKDEILESATGYFRGDLIIIDTDAAFIYDDEYEEILDLFEFANIQQLELRYFDRVLDEKLNTIYQEEVHRLPFSAYLPFIGFFKHDPIAKLGKLKADISVIIERFEDSIKLAGEPYFSELYSLLEDRLDLKSWSTAINRKMEIIRNIQMVYQHKTDVIREDILSILIIILIFIELIVGILQYFK